MPGRNRQPRPPRNTAQSSSHTPRTHAQPQPSRSQHPRSQYHHQPQHPHRGPDPRPVPPHTSVRPGTHVSIILKADQPTGRQVRGVVADVLTRGDHPRGVKVRLRDGRVGRVQGVSGGADADADAEERVREAEGRVDVRFERDVREEDGYLYEEGRGQGRVEGLFKDLEEADRRYQEGRGGRGTSGGGEVAVCPVCGEFEGDERAVAFHVEGHFAE